MSHPHWLQKFEFPATAIQVSLETITTLKSICSRRLIDRHIILVSPTTLLATLRTVENIWRYEKQNKNAERIAKDAGALHDQFVLLLESLDAIGNSLNKTQEAYTKARDRLQSGRGNLVKRVDDIRRLGAKTKKSIPGHLLEDSGADSESEELLLDVDSADDAGVIG